MEAEGSVLTLFDLFWFETLILRRNLHPPPPPVTPAISFDSGYAEPLSSEPSLLLRRHRRSRSDDLAPFPSLQIHSPKLQTILSLKVPSADPHPIEPPAGESRERRRFKRDLDIWGLRRRRTKGESKSLTDLEFEELKGIMDLGFTFSDVRAVDPRLVSIVPGLQKLRESALDGGDSAEESSSSASSDVDEDEERGDDLLRNWRIPSADEGVDMKDHLRLWAHAVASAVR